MNLKETFEGFKATFSPQSVASWGDHISKIETKLTWDFQEEGLVLDGIGNHPYIFLGVEKIDVIQHYDYTIGFESDFVSSRETEELMHDMIMRYWNDHKNDLMVISETGKPVYDVEKYTTTKKYLKGNLIWRS